MECNYSKLIGAFKKAAKEIEKTTELISHFLLTYLKYKINKENYKFLKEIKPSRITLLDKRVNVYHCRSGC